MWKKYLKELNFPESYVSITLGFLVVIVGALLVFNFFNRNKSSQTGSDNKAEEVKFEEKKEEGVLAIPAVHTVVKNETLWSIAEKYFKSGYNWVSIAKENKLANANKIYEGQLLNIPKAEVIKPVTQQISATATVRDSYTVVQGDNLWNIAIREYGKGFDYVKIAQANNLVNPRLIHAGNVLKLPR